MFIETDDIKGKMCVGFHLSNLNYHYAPSGTIRIARFENLFWPEINHGYYGDIYMKNFIRKWRTKTYENIQRRKDRKIANIVLVDKVCSDVNNIIIDFL
jgi:hypothetical protein